MPWIIDYYKGKRIIMLHSFIKKTQETPKRELEIARRRRRYQDHDQKSTH